MDKDSLELDRFNKILETIKSAHDFELDQNDKLLQYNQLVFLVVGILFNVGFLINTPNILFIKILKYLLLLSLGTTIIFSLPIFRQGNLKVSPDIKYFINTFKTKKYNQRQLTFWLIQNYEQSIFYNRKHNVKRHKDMRISISALAFSSLLLIIILGFTIAPLNINKNHNDSLHADSTAVTSSQNIIGHCQHCSSDSLGLRLHR